MTNTVPMNDLEFAIEQADRFIEEYRSRLNENIVSSNDAKRDVELQRLKLEVDCLQTHVENNQRLSSIMKEKSGD